MYLPFSSELLGHQFCTMKLIKSSSIGNHCRDLFVLFFLVLLTNKISLQDTPLFSGLPEGLCEGQTGKMVTNLKKSFIAAVKFYAASLFLCLLEVLFVEKQP